MSASKVTVATIGTWGHYVHVLAELTPLANVQYVAHARAMPDDGPEAVYRYTKQPNVPWHEDYRRMLREVRPQVVVISTRLDRIAPIAIEAAEAGCHLICEKPLAIEHAGLTKLWEACLANKVQCISMLGNGRFPGMLAAAKAIQAGAIGDVVLLNGRKSYKWGKNRPDWFADPSKYGNTISWIAIHAIEMVQVLSGQTFTSVTAMQSNQVHTDRPACQDNGVVLLGLNGGGHASVSFDYLRPEAAATHGDDWVRIVGSRGVIESKLDPGYCRMITAEGGEQELPLPPIGSYYADFLESRSAAVPSPEMRRAFMLSHVCLCANDASERKSVEAIAKMPWD